MIKRLEQRLEANPSDPNGWRMLGWSYFNTERFADAVKAYGRAVDLQKDNPTLRSLYGEAMVKAAGDMVTKEALAVFENIIAVDPSDERARYFKGLAKAQQGDNRGALDDWIALYKAAPADAEWVGDLRTHIQEVAQRSGIDLGDRLVKPAAGEPTCSPLRAPVPRMWRRRAATLRTAIPWCRAWSSVWQAGSMPRPRMPMAGSFHADPLAHGAKSAG